MAEREQAPRPVRSISTTLQRALRQHPPREKHRLETLP